MRRNRPSHATRALVVGLCIGLAPSGLWAQDCSISGQNQTVLATLRDWYYWYQQIPALSASSYASPEALLDAARYRPLDTSFSYISSAASSTAYYGESQYLGFGFSMKFATGYELRVIDVFPGSPAAEAGFDRGTEIRTLNGRSIQTVYESGEWNTIWGGEEPGYALDVGFTTREGSVQTARLEKRVVTIPTVPYINIYDVGPRKAGYVVFKNFVEPSYAALDLAFATVQASGATELILDLRYNGGGLVAVAQHLAGLIGGDRTSGEVFAQYVHNSKQSARNSAIRFPRPAAAMSLSRLIVITTKGSASASELLINALRPFLPVVVIGENTYGKPVGQYGFRFCDKMLWPVSFSIQNARGEGDYFGGFSPDCAAADDFTKPFGDPEEASLRAALGFAATGTCPAPRAAEVAAARAALPKGRANQENGWRALLFAY
jgi:C-terminal processing protease CtpA/Prc